MNVLENRYHETLRQHDVRSTKARLSVFTVLQAANVPLSLLAITQESKADRASVYRTLELFERLRIVNVILVGWKKQFELAAPYKTHHHHIHCQRCGTVISIKSPSLEKLIHSIAEQKGFQLERHTLELSGQCEACQEAGTGI